MAVATNSTVQHSTISDDNVDIDDPESLVNFNLSLLPPSAN